MTPPDRNELTQKVQSLLKSKGEKTILSKNWVDGFINKKLYENKIKSMTYR